MRIASKCKQKKYPQSVNSRQISAFLTMSTSSSTEKVTKAKKSQDVKPKLGRKRRFPNQNKDIRKKLCNTNQSYYNTRGHLVEAKTFKPGECNCKSNCSSLLNIAEQEKLFKCFHALGSFTARMVFLSQTVEERPKASERSLAEVSRRNYTRTYRLNHKKVCQHFYISLLQICASRVDSALEKWKKEEFTDLRGVKKRNDTSKAHVNPPNWMQTYWRFIF